MWAIGWANCLLTSTRLLRKHFAACRLKETANPFLSPANPVNILASFVLNLYNLIYIIGAGKTETTKYVLKYLAAMAGESAAANSTSLALKVLKSTPILEVKNI